MLTGLLLLIIPLILSVTAVILSHSSIISPTYTQEKKKIYFSISLSHSWIEDKVKDVCWLKVDSPNMFLMKSLELEVFHYLDVVHFYIQFFFFHKQNKNSQDFFILCIIINRLLSQTSNRLSDLSGIFIWGIFIKSFISVVFIAYSVIHGLNFLK